MEPQWLNDVEQVAWRSILRGTTLLLVQLDRDLDSAEGISLAEYDVLVVLSEGPPEGVRMSVLAEKSLLSKSRLSHCVDRLALAGLVQRIRTEADRRGLQAKLTKAGWERMETLAPVHVASVRRSLIDVLSTDELVLCGTFADRIIDAIDQQAIIQSL